MSLIQSVFRMIFDAWLIGLFPQMTYEKLSAEEMSEKQEEEALLATAEDMEFTPVSEEEERELLEEVAGQAIDTPSDSIRLDEGRITTSGTRIGMGNDGVFSNMSAKPAQGKVFEEIEPPSYHEVVVDPSPDYFVSCVDENGEILIEGFPVGNYFVFFLNTFISMTFDVLGFFLTTLMATTHAARYGSQSGLGLTLMRYVF
jgi:hypothetical protein